MEIINSCFAEAIDRHPKFQSSFVYLIINISDVSNISYVFIMVAKQFYEYIKKDKRSCITYVNSVINSRPASINSYMIYAERSKEFFFFYKCIVEPQTTHAVIPDKRFRTRSLPIYLSKFFTSGPCVLPVKASRRG